LREHLFVRIVHWRRSG